MRAVAPPQGANCAPSGDARIAPIALSLISHTNAGKTTLARTLLGKDVGEVRDAPNVTLEATPYPMVDTPDGDALILWDTPGFGDTVRLMTRLRREGDPIGWFLHQVWDRVLDRPLWCSQEAVRNVRQEADVVLYLVNATEDPETAGYMKHELELLAWMRRPVLIVLNQVAGSDAATVERWRAHLAAFPVGRGVLSLDAFSRGWVEESLVLERVAGRLHRTVLLPQPAALLLDSGHVGGHDEVVHASTVTQRLRRRVREIADVSRDARRFHGVLAKRLATK